ncbi:MAG TPA: hypothetical protein VMV49_01765 [Candidatus Deferrimicrobium sp.]|nr:hypothetical protein [Candidatus Deferrimicrobium sp.]
MSTKKEPNNNNSEKEPEEEPEWAIEEGEKPTVIKKRKGKRTIISETEAEPDSEKLVTEITDLLKRARSAIAEQNFLVAVKSYQEASIAAGMAGDTEREKIYIARANEILNEHPELKEQGLVILKKRKMKAILRKEEKKFSAYVLRIVSYIFVAGILIILIFSGLFSAIILQELLELGGSYSISMLWGICCFIEIIGLILAYLLATRWLSWAE